MTELSVLERVRAAVAEAGYDPTAVYESTRGSVVDYTPSKIPTKVMWRARETVGLRLPLCWRCWEPPDHRRRHGHATDACLAGRRFVEDCGRDRSEP